MINDPIQGIAFEKTHLTKGIRPLENKTPGKTKYEKHFKFTWLGRHKKIATPKVVVIEPDSRTVLINNFRARK